MATFVSPRPASQVDEHFANLQSGAAVKAPQHKPELLELSHLRVNVQPTEELAEQITTHNERVDQIERDYAAGQALPEIDFLTITLPKLNAARDKRLATKLKVLQEALQLSEQSLQLYDRLRESWSAEWSTIAGERDALIQQVTKGLEDAGYTRGADARRITGLANGSELVRGFDHGQEVRRSRANSCKEHRARAVAAGEMLRGKLHQLIEQLRG
jgi:hypothetical protein